MWFLVDSVSIGFGTVIDFEITCRRYFADKILGLALKLRVLLCLVYG